METNARGPKDLIFTRSQFEGFLHACCRAPIGTTYRIGVKKHVYHLWGNVELPIARDFVRQLDSLVDHMINGTMVDLPQEKGLWMPTVVDADAGHRRLFVTASPNWLTQHMGREEILLEMAEVPYQDVVRGKLHEALLQWPILRLCCPSGSTYRLRTVDRDGRGELSALHQFAVILDPDQKVRYFGPSDRPRAKRSDAIRGEKTPLFVFTGVQGPRGGRKHWRVYPPNPKVLERYLVERS